MQTILGAGGAIGRELAGVLPQYTDQIRLVSRTPTAVLGNEDLVSADLTDPQATASAVAGSEIVYLTVGLPYRTNIWQEKWPLVMRSTIDACRQHGARLVFFDNIYMYAPDRLDPIVETLPHRPATSKGKVRAAIVRMLWEAVERGEITAVIARCADFYGPDIKQNSVLTETVFKRLAAGKAAQWLGGADYKHSFTFTPDAAKATALLGNTPDAYGEAWHLPTASHPPTGREWVELIAQHYDAPPNIQVAPKWMVRLLGLFSADMREIAEMMYQYTQDYVFDSSKFEQRFGLQATPYEEGIRQVVVRS